MTGPAVGVHVDHRRLERELAEGLRSFERRLTGELYTAGDEAAAEARATSLYKDRTGRLRQRTGVRARSFFEVQIAARTDYASYVHDGTPRHTISAKNNGLLTFQVNGQWRSVKSVDHPGTKPRPFLRIAVDAGMARLAERIEAVAEAAFG